MPQDVQSLKFYRDTISRLEYTIQRQKDRIDSLTKILGEGKQKIGKRSKPLCQIYKETIEESISHGIDCKTRKTAIIDGRKMYYAILRQRTLLSLNEMAATLHICQNHATIINALNTHSDLIVSSKKYRILFELINQRIDDKIREEL
jgi:chromosomal replication initiation ATPase DnaA